MKTPKNLPRGELLKAAQDARERYPGSTIHFKFTCGYCGTRCTLSDPNVLYESGQCYQCGHDTAITQGGFTLIMQMTGLED